MRAWARIYSLAIIYVTGETRARRTRNWIGFSSANSEQNLMRSARAILICDKGWLE